MPRHATVCVMVNGITQKALGQYKAQQARRMLQYSVYQLGGRLRLYRTDALAICFSECFVGRVRQHCGSGLQRPRRAKRQSMTDESNPRVHDVSQKLRYFGIARRN